MRTYKHIIDEIRPQLGSADLMAVSKTRSIEEIMAVYDCGVRLFGENHVQEIVEKFSVPRPADMKVHMIGHLQSNKVSKVVPLVDMIQSIDSFQLLEKVNNACVKIGKVMPVLLEFNTSEEENKSGFLTETDLFDCIESSDSLSNVRICGLMTVGPLGNDVEKTTTSFAKLRSLSVECKSRFPQKNFSIISMGMSGDWKIAVKQGSNLVRIGTAIFGERNYV